MDTKLTSFRLFQIAQIVVVLFVIVELGGIWKDIHEMRKEQVKNALYSFPVEYRAELPDVTKRRLESSSHVDGSVEIEGEVKVEEPLEVEVDPQ